MKLALYHSPAACTLVPYIDITATGAYCDPFEFEKRTLAALAVSA